MELDDFIHRTLVAITRSVEKANDDLADSKALINPPQVMWIGDHGKTGVHDPNNVSSYTKRVELIEFDVAVEATESEKNASNVSAGISVLGGKMAGTSEANRRHESRIKFTVPLCLPQGSKRGATVELR